MGLGEMGQNPHNITVLNVRLSHNICPFGTPKTVVQFFFHSLGARPPRPPLATPMSAGTL